MQAIKSDIQNKDDLIFLDKCFNVEMIAWGTSDKILQSPLRDGCCRGGREAALCSCLLSCWNSAPSANPFNSRPAVFVWADVQTPNLTSGWTLHVLLLVSVDLLLNYHTVLWLMYAAAGECPNGKYPMH